MSERYEREDSRPSSQPEKIDLLHIVADFLYGLKKLWVLLLVVVVACTLRSYFATSSSYTPSYVASATMSVTTVSGGGGYMDSKSAEQMATVFPYVLTSGVLADVVADYMGLDALPGSVSVTAEEGTNLLTVSATSSDPQAAYDLLHAMIECYPQVGEFVFGQTTLEILDETGVPTDTQKEVVIRGSYKRGAVQGLVLALVILCVYVLSHRTVQSTDQLKKQVNLSRLASITYVRGKKRKKKNGAPLCILNSHVPETYLESIRKLRMRVAREMEEKGYKTLMVTSSVPGEGKTTIAANLAVALARQGKKVILVDCDARNPSLAHVLGSTDEHPSLGQVLRGEAELDTALCDVSVDSSNVLRVLYGGKPSKADALLLGRTQMEELIGKLREQADIVILDTAPAQLLADASLMARYVDAALYVVRYDYTKMKRIRAGIQALDVSGIHMLGYVFNSDQSAKGKRHSRGYDYGYGYGYGYGRYWRYSHYSHYAQQDKMRQTGKQQDGSGRVIKN